LGEVHQSNKILAICNSFIRLWATSNSLVQSKAVWSSSTEILGDYIYKCLGELQELY